MGDTLDEDLVARLNPHIPHSARWWNYLLGGNDNFAADRKVGDAVMAQMPEIRDIARAGRGFLDRAVTYLTAEAGIRQFLDLGTGLPSAGNTHEVAQHVAPESRIVYVDNDPLVLAHARALLVSSPEGATDYIDADVRDPDTILARAAATLDFSQPIAVLMVGILGHISDDHQPSPAQIVATFLDAVPAGSYLAINDSVITAKTAEAIETARDAGGDYHLRTVEEITAFFAGLDVVAPGVVSTPFWRPKPHDKPKELDVYCGLARKP
ncbi:SAM-dependent methyltransferase [Micromonospora sp. WMMD1082]|uniref:SAM-dependent methyltransferase n=1 Tax=Micromonospora sp. WMMD1082 TaxID=3016104 RepID=UPI002416CC3C|nr:SAM-dependent methyltransferase [Micromonospora sp. WMMD1082]MDG4795200.1 SAM-dependent methyltransferase [Micromonospora sp. WMMD1082]